MAEVVLALHVVMVAVHRFHIGGEGLGAKRLDCRYHILHHQLAVTAGEFLRPMHGLHVVIEMFRALREVRQVLIRQVDVEFFHVLLHQFDKVRADAVTHPARTGMQHKPHVLAFIQAHFDEVVVCPQRPQMPMVVGVLQALMFGADNFKFR